MTSPAPGIKVGPIRLVSGVTRRNLLAYFYAAFFTIGMVAFVSAMQPYLLTENLGISTDEEGWATGRLQFAYEIIVMVLMGPLGALADRIGRKPIYTVGFIWIGAAMILFPLVTTFGQLLACRMFYAVGSACITCMMATVLADYPRNETRGAMAAVSAVCNGLGVIMLVIIGGQLPRLFAGMGYDTLTAGRFTYWCGTVLCVISALVVFRGLKPGKPGAPKEHQPILELLAEGAAAARANPRIAVACVEAFVARGDLVVVSSFFVLWAKSAGMEQGLSLEEAISKGTQFAGLIAAVSLIWAPIWGRVLDSFDRVSVLAAAMLLAAAGYFWAGFSENPIATAFIPAAVVLGIGEFSAIVSGATLIGQEAPEDIRGSVLGLFNLCGSIGIVTITLVGGYLFDAWMPGGPFVAVGFVNLLIFFLAVAVRLRTGYRAPSAAVAAAGH